ncbi:PIH1 domain-containing protein 1 [Trichoplax sp. H2]|nr:PIH1 domain-containing protein 1 [Trichoplax sp. H2]|eukprot:RDD45851.1 PIH1 domain-containing protein 1 [Trichoplax sp. H2]
MDPSVTEEEFLRQLLSSNDKQPEPHDPERKSLLPKPGHCIKTRTSTDEKVFINICTSDQIPAPRDISEDELEKIVQSEDPTKFRVPMSLGVPHAELDKGGKGCTVFDVVINKQFYDKTQRSQAFDLFFLTLVFDGLENKYDMTFSRDTIVLKNRKFFGKMAEQTIRTKSKPLIMEMETRDISSDTTNDMQGKTLVTEIEEKRGEEPSLQIIREPPEGRPDFLVAQIDLPKVVRSFIETLTFFDNVKSAKTVDLDVGGDKLILLAHPNVYFLNTNLPFKVNSAETGAQFHRKTKVLTVTMPVADD